MKGMILAAGFGTRFRPATWEAPKPLLPLANRPLAGWALEAMLADGVDEVAVNLHHLPEPLERYLQTTYGSRARFTFSREETILGTGGGIRRLRSFFEEEEIFVVANGDTVQMPPFRRLADTCRREGALAALLLREPPPGDRFTPVWSDGRRVTGFGEGSGKALMFAGAHALSRAVFDRLPDRDVSGITEDVYFPAAKAGTPPLAAVVDDGLWFDIGTPARYLQAQGDLLGRMARGELEPPAGSGMVGGSLIAKDAAVQGTLDGSVAGERVSVARRAHVAQSALWAGAEVAQETRVKGSIIGYGVRVPPGGEVENALLCRRVPGVDYPEETIVVGLDLVAVPVTEDGTTLIAWSGNQWTRRR